MVIIALLVGGVLVGKDLIEASHVRAQIKQIEKYQTAANIFRDKYLCWPGDCVFATRYFPQRSQNCNTNPVVTPEDTTCNGNGDFIVYQYGATDPIMYKERMLFWQHMKLAGLIDGTFASGYTSSTFYGQDIGLSVPPSAYPGGGIEYGVSYFGGARGPERFDLGTTVTSNGNSINGAILSGPAAFSMDGKMDDGKPNAGRVRGYSYAASGYPANYTGISTPDYYLEFYFPVR